MNFTPQQRLVLLFAVLGVALLSAGLGHWFIETRRYNSDEWRIALSAIGIVCLLIAWAANRIFTLRR